MAGLPCKVTSVMPLTVLICVVPICLFPPFSDHIRHIVQAGRLAAHINRGVDRAGREKLLRLRRMRERDHLVIAGENDLVLADDRAAADGVQADLALPALFPLGVAVVHILRFAVAHAGDGVGQHERRAARRVNLLVVVLLDDLDVELAAEYLGRLFRKLDQKVDAERHVARIKDGLRLRGGLQRFHLLCAVAGRAEHGGNAALLRGVAEDRREEGGVGEIDDDVDRLLDRLDLRVIWKSGGSVADQIHARRDRAVRTVGDELLHGAPHLAEASAEKNSNQFYQSLSLRDPL